MYKKKLYAYTFYEFVHETLWDLKEFTCTLALSFYIDNKEEFQNIELILMSENFNHSAVSIHLFFFCIVSRQ